MGTDSQSTTGLSVHSSRILSGPLPEWNQTLLDGDSVEKPAIAGAESHRGLPFVISRL